MTLLNKVELKTLMGNTIECRNWVLRVREILEICKNLIIILTPFVQIKIWML